MIEGLLWFDNSTDTLNAKVKKAARYYKEKYGCMPDLCLVHPSMVKKGDLSFVGKIYIRPYRPVLPGHIWIGIEDKK